MQAQIRHRSSYPAIVHRAVHSGDMRILKILLEHNADVTAVDIGRATALHHAATRGSLEMVIVLLDEGFSLSTENKLGNTPLCLAAKRGDIMIVEAGHHEVTNCITQTLPTSEELVAGTAVHIAVAERNYGKVGQLLNSHTRGSVLGIKMAVWNCMWP